MPVRPSVARSLETGLILGILTAVLALTGLLLSPTANSATGGLFDDLQDQYGSGFYVVHISAGVLLVTFTLVHLLPLGRSFRPPAADRRQFVWAHILFAFIVVQVVSGYVLWFRDYSFLGKSTAVHVHLYVTFLLFVPFVPHAIRGWREHRKRDTARVSALLAANERGRASEAIRAQERASRRAFLRMAAYATAGLALAYALGAKTLAQVQSWKLNYVGQQPRLDPHTWRLRVTGLVEKPVTLTFDDLLDLPQHTLQITHRCVEGWDYTDTFTGVRLSDILARAGAVDTKARMVILKSPEISTQWFGSGMQYTTNYTYDPNVLPDIYLCHKVQGGDMPAEHGGPVRALSNRKWGYKACKWLTEIELSADATYKGYWETFGYHNNGDYPGPIFA